VAILGGFVREISPRGSICGKCGMSCQSTRGICWSGKDRDVNPRGVLADRTYRTYRRNGILFVKSASAVSRARMDLPQ
jgi:hypothetical protein